MMIGLNESKSIKALWFNDNFNYSLLVRHICFIESHIPNHFHKIPICTVDKRQCTLYMKQYPEIWNGFNICCMPNTNCQYWYSLCLIKIENQKHRPSSHWFHCMYHFRSPVKWTLLNVIQINFTSKDWMNGPLC